MNRKFIIQLGTFVSFVLAAIAVSAIFTPHAQSKTNQGNKMKNETAIRESFEAWGKGTGSPYNLLADDVEWTITGKSTASRIYTSKEDFMSNVIRPFGARMATPLVPTIKHLFTDGDTIILHFDASGTAKDGRTYANTYAWFLTFKNDRIVKATAFFDSIAFNELWNRVKPIDNSKVSLHEQKISNH